MTAPSNPPAARADRDPTELHRFSGLVAALEQGDLDLAVTAKLKKLIEDLRTVSHHRGTSSGSLTFKLSINFSDDVAEIRGEATTTQPKMPRPKSLMWVSEAGNFTQTNPRQRALPFRDVSAGGPGPAVRDAAGGGVAGHAD